MVATSFPALEEVVNSITDLRPMSEVATRVLELSQSDGSSTDEIATVITADQALSAKLLRLSNSAYYGFPRRIATIREAVVLLGLQAVRSATLASCVMDTMEGTNIIKSSEFWRFSVTVGMLTEVSASATRTFQQEAFTAGVMHNVGQLALDQQLPDGLREAIKYSAEHEVTLSLGEQAVLGFTAFELGAALALHWNFPESLADALASHARPAPDSLAAHISRARGFAQALGLPDGLRRGQLTVTPASWTVPPFSIALRRFGEIEGVLERADAFLSSATGR